MVKIKLVKSFENKINPTIFPTGIIPDSSQKSLHSKNTKGDEFRWNNFMYQIPKRQVVEDEEEPLEIDLTEDEYNYAVRMTKHSIQKITKSDITELRAILKPHPNTK